MGIGYFWALCKNTQDEIQQLQQRLRHKILQYFRRHDLLEPKIVEEMLAWNHSGGFSLDASVRIEAWDRAGLERLLRYCARPPFASERLGESISEPGILIYTPSRPTPDGQTFIQLSPLELLQRIADFIPPPRVHQIRYWGVFAPNAPWRPQVTALAGQQPLDAHTWAPEEPDSHINTTPDATPTQQPQPSSSCSSLWAMLLARIFAIFPLTCPRCGQEVRIIAFILDPQSIRHILQHIGEPTEPPPISPARGPPQWEGELEANIDPQPEFEFDQTLH